MTTISRPLPAPPKRVNCPRPDKQAFPTREISEAKRIEQLGIMVQKGKEHLPSYSYHCPCTYWHWTSMEPGKRAQLAELREFEVKIDHRWLERD